MPASNGDGARSALVIATSRYADSRFRALRAPGSDAAELAEVLGDPAVGGFSVTPLTDPTSRELKVRVAEHLARRRAGDLLVLYLSGHGVRDARGQLHLVASDTLHAGLAATGVEARWLLDRLDECAAREQVVILDCCFSGAFAAGAKGDGDDVGGDLAQLSGRGRGRIVLTASRATEYSFEGHAVAGAAIAGSVFTAGLIDGVRTGTADIRGEGRISVDDAFAYACDFVRRHRVNQTPQRWGYGLEGTIWLARTPRHRTPPPNVPRGGLLPDAPIAQRPTPAAPSITTRPVMDGALPILPASGPEAQPPAGTIVGWGGRNPSVASAFTTALEFGRMVPPAGLRDAVAVSAGSRHALAALADGSVHAWGENTFGQVRPPRRRLGTAVAVSAGGTHSLALLRDGSVVGWGNNNSGQARTPGRLPAARQVAAGGWHSLALLTDGTVAGWGDSVDGQARPPAGLTEVVAVAAGDAHSLALHSDGTVVAWGRDDHGQCRVPMAAVDVVAIAAGEAFSVALRRDGRLLTWGNTPVPARLEAARLVGARALSAGAAHCLVLGRDGVVHAFGDNSYQQCAIPYGIGGILTVSAGGAFSLALAAQ